jgi:hypothetical protein
MNTEQVIAGMLKENTGRHMLDSGGAYGRNWEQNQGRDFAEEQESYVEFRAFGDSLEICVTHNLYHWLNERLEYDPRMQAMFDKYAELPQNEDESWLTLMEEFAKRLGGKGIYGEGEPMTINTHNGEDLLSQTIQYTYFEILDIYGPPSLTKRADTLELIVEGGDYVLLQVHGGCDVRGGYTAPKAFRVSGDGSMFDNAGATIQCSTCSEHNWYTDDGYHYYDNGTCGVDYKQLETYPTEEVEEEPVPVAYNPDLFKKGETPCNYEYAGTVLVYEKRAFCPFCGGELKVYMY